MGQKATTDAVTIIKRRRKKWDELTLQPPPEWKVWPMIFRLATWRLEVLGVPGLGAKGSLAISYDPAQPERYSVTIATNNFTYLAYWKPGGKLEILYMESGWNIPAKIRRAVERALPKIEPEIVMTHLNYGRQDS